MIGVPNLSRHDITEQLERLYRADRNRRHLVAFFGTGTEEAVSTTTAGQFLVVPVRSELELRERMPPLEDEHMRIAFLVPWATEIPIDLSGRFARSGRVHRVGPEERLRTTLGVSEIDDDVRKSRLAAYLLASSPPPMQVSSGRLTMPALWNAWLHAMWGIDVTGGLGRDTLLGWASLDQKGAGFTEAMSAAPAGGVRDELLAYLGAQLGVAGPVIWKAWESGRGRLVLAYALLFETLAGSEHAGVRMWVNLMPRDALRVDNDGDMASVARALGDWADGALRYVERQAQVSVARAIVREADALVQSVEVREALVVDRRLPSAWRARLEALGRALAALAKDPTADRLAHAVTWLKALYGHAMFSDGDQMPVLHRAEMTVRLGAWLVARPDRQLQGPPTPYADVELLARWYAEEGGYVDWARRAARGTGGDVFGMGAEAVVESADEARQALDQRFARALSSWVEAGRPSTQVVPIDDAVKRIAARFLEQEPDRQLLVLLLDGMAWAQAVELLQSLGSRTVPWGPLAWHGSANGKIGQGVYPAVLANLPTVTDVSRAAFFGGKALEPGGAWSTAKDVTRWGEHREIARLTGNQLPKLLLRGESHTPSGSASPDALSLVADTRRRVVAIVINAIDASLKSDPQQRHAWTVDSIQSLPELLEKARASGRAVLLASDHGHVPADRLKSQGSFEKAGARWRPWLSADEALGPHELGFRGSKVWSPKDTHGVVLLIDDASRYGGAAHAGEHGGATLAEVVAPCLLVGCEELGGSVCADRGLDVRAAFVPGWWHFDLPSTRTVEPDPSPPAQPRRPKKTVSANQLALLPIEPPPAPPPPPPRTESAFARSAVLASLNKPHAERKQIIEAVEFLLERQGVASDAAFAAALDVASWRIGGIVAKLQEALNVDGYQVLRFDAAAKTIHLDREKLAQQFEVTL